jgi:hypothetical protein
MWHEGFNRQGEETRATLPDFVCYGLSQAHYNN